MTAVYVLLILLGIIALLYLSGGAAIAVYMNFSGKRTNAQVAEYEINEKKLDAKLLDEPYEPLYIKSRFGYRLHARFFKAKEPSHKYIVDVHGRGSSSISQLKYLNIFRETGYNILLPDQKYSGESGGRMYSFGFYERHDVAAWLDELRRTDPRAEFMLFGESMGAATSILVASEDARIKALIAYCSFSSPKDVVLSHTGKDAPLFLKYFIPAYRIVSSLVFGINLSRLNIAKALSGIRIPTLIIHSYDDEVVPICHARKLIAANDKTEVTLFADGAHARAVCTRPEEFKKAILGFIERSGF